MKIPICLLMVLSLSHLTALSQQTDSTAFPPNDTEPITGQPRIVEAIAAQEIPAAEVAPAIDGEIGAGEWQGALSLEACFTEYRPILGRKDAEPVVTRLLHDRDNLYVAFQVAQDPATIVEKKGTRDKAWEQDMIGIVIDPLGNRQEMYYVFFGVSGTLMDTRAVRSAINEEEDQSWDGEFAYRIKRTESGYQVEAVIPFSNFRRSGGDRMDWNLNLYRYTAHTKRQSTYSPWQNFSMEAFYNSLLPFAIKGAARPAQPLEVMPYGIYGQETDGAKVRHGDAGVDARLPLGTRAVANLAFNPDFSQLEGDPFQFTFNNQYALYLAEYRPFFVEERGVFQNVSEMYYSRAIQNPFLAGRFTYKDEKNQAGAIMAVDETDTMIGNHDALATVLRYKRQFGNSLAGLMALDRRDRDALSANTVLEADGMAFLPLGIKLNYIAAASYRKDNAGASYSDKPGYYYKLFPSYFSRHWTAILNLVGMSPGFENQLGYVTKNDFDHFGGYVTYSFYDLGPFQKVEVGEDWSTDTKWQRYPHAASAHRDSMEYILIHQANLTMFNSTFVQLMVQNKRQLWRGVYLNHDYFNWYQETKLNKYLSFNTSGRLGTAADYNKMRVGRQVCLVGNVFLNPVPALALNAGAALYDVRADTSRQALRSSEAGSGTWQWRTRSYDWGASYSPTNTLTLKAIGQYGLAKFAPGYYLPQEARTREDRYFGVLEYKPSKGNTIYLGYRYHKQHAGDLTAGEVRQEAFFKFSHNFLI